MWKHISLFLGLICFGLLDSVLANDDPNMSSGSAYLEPWIVGIIAVCCFLVLTFLFVLFTHYFCDKFYDKDEDYPDEDLEDFGPSAVISHTAERVQNVYDNQTFNPQEEQLTEL
uniref:uncharacterized protein LOC113474278 n=1 Tax=Ciona intestinalis TaxID=7719 RepID=UPI000EF52940|nr:uncharacterized protein LOC113474278 [Ciona intestinalis]|eukprot:XP_026690506.1 uncharacterized protein LOC113474278 [Ciona intestinalis]